jgi:hypothetical protein
MGHARGAHRRDAIRRSGFRANIPALAHLQPWLEGLMWGCLNPVSKLVSYVPGNFS